MREIPWRQIGLSLTAVTTVPAFATPAPDLPSLTVAVTTQDLATETATERVIKRLRSAAHQVCKEVSRSDSGYLYSRACYVGTLEDASAQLDKLRSSQFATLSAASILVVAR